MAGVITGLSSMATRQLLADLAQEAEQRHGIRVRFEAAGGVVVAERARAGEAADLVVLAEGAMAELAADGVLRPGTLRPLVASPMVAAVPQGSPPPPLVTGSDLREALARAGRIAYSTGPSGRALLALVERCGLAGPLADRLVQAPPGVPVGSLLASGEADLGFQQLSELRDLPGVRVLGPLPGDAAVTSVFSGAVLAASPRPGPAEEALRALTGGRAAELARARGMELLAS